MKIHLSKPLLIKIAATLATIALLTVGVVQFISVNAQYPNTKLYSHHINEEIKAGAVSVTFTGNKLYTYDEFKKQVLPDYQSRYLSLGNTTDSYKEYHMLVNITLKNNSDTTQTFPLGSKFTLETYISAHAMDANLFFELNKDILSSSNSFKLPAHSQTSMVLPYNFNTLNTPKKLIDNVYATQFDVTVSYYPEKHFVLLNKG
ncbi:MAG: hypothetical protein LBM65_02670 [Oscillospiraceae bacterium]|jgi:hypothetical protein|nr:hypothetical protein [Oscillospiraceae bacterium]